MLSKFSLVALLLHGFAAFATNTATSIAPGCTAYGSLFIESNGSLWGMGDVTGLGEITAEISRPEEITSSNVIAAAVAGDGYFLFVKSGGSVWGMGNNSLGGLGLTNLPNPGVAQPTEIPLTNVVAVAVGFGHSLFLESDGSLWGVGDDTEGQLGDGGSYFSVPDGPFQPEKVVSCDVTKIAAGSDFSLFLKSDGSLWGMGDNSWGQLGDGNLDPYNEFAYTNLPEEIVASNVTAIAAGCGHSLFLKSDGSLWAMGMNLSGQLGNGGNGAVAWPEMIISSNVTAIAAGAYFSLFLKSDGSLWAMGDDYYGQLGDGNLSGSTTPWLSTNQPEEIICSNVIAITAGQYHSLFLKSDGSLWGMGDDINGQLGDGFQASQTSIPEQIFPTLQPVLMESVSSGTNLQFNATCSFGGNFYLLTSTNLALPLCQWTPIWTNTIIFHEYNAFSATLTNAANSGGQQFFILQSH
jgi:alpha-tubulin suppressor-like RCC1 family protein